MLSDMDLGPGELAIILVIILVLFGGKKLPELARSLGQAKKEFESSSTSDTAGSKDTADTGASAPHTPAAPTKAVDRAADEPADHPADQSADHSADHRVEHGAGD